MTSSGRSEQPRSDSFKLHTGLPLPNQVKQVDGLQILRAIAVILVCWLHTGNDLGRISGTILPNLDVFGIDIFFVISGFILSLVVLRSRYSRGPSAAWQFFKRRLLRIYPIYWIFCCIGIALYLHRNHTIDLRLMWASVLLLPFVHYPRWLPLVDYTWTLVFEMLFYFMLAGIQLVTVRRAVPALVGVQCLLVSLRHFVPITRPVRDCCVQSHAA